MASTAPTRRPGYARVFPYAGVTAAFALVLVLVPPQGDFPLNDDWAYAKVVEHLVATGNFEPNLYAAPTFFLQAYWAAGFVEVFGFSFDTLRISTLVAALGVLWGSVWLAREAGLSGRNAFLAGLLVVVNPLFLNLSYTFMTDVPFLALLVLGTASYARALRTGLARWILLGGLFAAAAFFIRQFAVLLPPAFFAAALMKLRHGWRPSWREGAAFVAPGMAAAVGLVVLPVGGETPPLVWDWSRLGGGWAERALTILRHGALSSAYLGLFILPAALAVVPRSRRGLREGRKGALGVLALVAVMLVLLAPSWYNRVPKMGNIIYDLGIGPLLLPGVMSGGAISAPVQIGAWWWPITCGGLLAGAWGLLRSGRAVAGVLQRRSEESESLVAALLVLWAVFLVGILILPPFTSRFDRYLLMTTPHAAVLALWLTRGLDRPREAAVLAGCLVLGACSVIGLQDYLAWNRARWEATERLRAVHDVALTDINGGYEFNGWHHSDRYVEASREQGKKVFGPKGWWIVNDAYAVSTVPLKRFETFDRVPYDSWLGFTERSMLLQRRVEPDPYP